MFGISDCFELRIAVTAAAAVGLAACDGGSIGGLPPEQVLGAQGERDEVSVVRGIDRNRGRDGERRDQDDRRDRAAEFRHIDGTGNNQRDETLGAVDTVLARWVAPDYPDGVSAMTGEDRRSPRVVSNEVVAQFESVPNPHGASDYLWQWGQFLDHDLDLTDAAEPPEPAPIVVPTGDAFFDPESSGAHTMPFNRSLYDRSIPPNQPRQQLNEITHWIDASNVYGSDEERASALRANDGTGKLLVSEGDLLPFNEDGLSNAGGESPSLFVAGDPRANEQIALIAMHTLFVREHNRLAEEIAASDRNLSGDEIYERARQIVGAQMQVITYEEFLPALLGPNALERYRGYDDRVDPRISNLFSTAVFRVGHSMLSATLLRVDRRGREIREGHLPLRDSFFAPNRIIDEGGIEPVLRGLAAQECQQVDIQVVDDVRSFLFGPPGAGGLDLPALNIQRGRDHGLPGYNAVRVAMGLAPRSSFDDVTSDSVVRARLAMVYDSPDDIDVWVGGLAEDPVNGGHVGELIFTVLKRQFENLRDGDRFWYESSLPRDLRDEVARTRLSDIIRRNTRIGNELPDDVFRAR